MLERLWHWWSLGITPQQALPADTVRRLEHLRRRWREVMATVTAAPRQRPLHAVPWYLVVGPAGAGKSNLLGSSGLALDSVISNDPAAPPEPFTVWFNDQAVYIEVAGRLLHDGDARHDWSVLLHLIGRARRHLPLNGVVVVKPLAEQFRRTPAETAADATQVRDRLQLLSNRCGSVVPLYVVISKADLLGGFKEFFANADRQERERVLGMTMSWPPARDPVQEVTVAYEQLLDSLRDRRLGALAATGAEAAQRKLLQFPPQLRAALPFLTDWLAIAARPHQDGEPTLRGVYLTSSLPPAKPAASEPQATSTAEEHPPSLFFDVPAKATPGTVPVASIAKPAEQPQASFVTGVFARVLQSDFALARPTAPALRRARQVRLLCLAILPAILVVIIAGGWWTTWRGVHLIEGMRTPLAELTDGQHGAAQDITERLLAIDRFGTALQAAHLHHGPRLGPAGEAAAQRYIAAVHPLLIDACLRSIHDELSAVRRAQASQVGKDGVADLLRTYQMLGGLLPPQTEQLTRTLLDGRRWFRGVDPPGGSCEFRIEALARQQLDLCVGTLLPAGLLPLDIDRSLVADLHRELGDRLVIEQAYSDLVHRLQPDFAAVPPESLVGDPTRSALMADVTICRFYSQEAWDSHIARAVDDQADTVVADLAAQKLPHDRATIIGRLRQRFVDDHQQKWLAVLASMRAALVRDFRDTTAQLDRLSGEDSPVPRFITGVLGNLTLTVADATTRTRTDGGWIRPCLQALGSLRGDVIEYQQALALAKRTTDVDRVRTLISRFNAVSTRIGEHLTQVEPLATRTALQRGFDGLLRSLIADLDRTCIDEIDQLWSQQVAQAFAAHLAKRFPFSPTAVEDVPMAEFAAFFNPDGTLWTVLKQIETLRDVSILGKPMVVLDEAYPKVLRTAQNLRAQFFAGSSPTVTLRFGYRLQQREHVRDLKALFGGTTHTLYERPDARYQAEILQAGPFIARVAIQTVSGEWKHREHGGDWGFLHLLRAGQPMLTANGELVCTWEHDMPVAGKSQTVKATVVLEAGGMVEVVNGELLSGLSLPRRVIGSAQP